MRVLVISDNHRSMDEFYRLMKQVTDVDTVIHLGDSEVQKWEYEKYMPQCMPFICLKGNNDFGMELPERFCAMLGGHKVAAVHGHRHQVKVTMEPLERWARSEQAELVCFGHTHHADVNIKDGMLFLNPGSLSGRYSHTGQTYAMVELTDTGITATLFSINGRKIKEKSI